ncbi:hypothetical protein ABB30_02215 [Stenotrophomonas ginsengisoli]|uniref:DUF1684 domain-containing protein n=1 Tax=Stenotrophomonas ginsengisoli TaxID=336566 RepID=A0A0R0DMJ8_9GAMM|nr:DUF1684 domain-containing protein [Stenotrophomonas ginsengisoli]KRG78872.1 hypothetical protein ABB30_02215 [Stenotrophomonas ginsengisoli]
MDNNKKMLGVLLGACLAVLAGCGGKDKPEGGEQASVSADDLAFLNDNQAWRIERHSHLVQPDGWTSLVGLHWLTLKAHYIGSGATSGLRLAVGPEKMGLIRREDGKVWFTPEAGAQLRINDQPVRGRILWHSDQDAEPTVITFDEGKGSISLLQRGSHQALRVRHADASTRQQFAGLDYWPADRRWAVPARFVAHTPARTLQVVDMVGMNNTLANPGRLEFERGGQRYSLEAVGNPDGSLLVIMADRTSGHGSYAAGRYIDVPAPDAQGAVVLDFNRSYNPPCAFTIYATCPLPPAENRLDLRIEAGEKAYAHKPLAQEAGA